MVLLLASGAPCKIPSLSQRTKESVAYVPGEQAVVLCCATRGRMEHILGGAYQNLMETAPRGLKKAWILEALGPFLLKAVERPTSILCLHSSRTFHNISDWSFRSLVQFLPFEVTQNILFCPSIHSFIWYMPNAYSGPGFELCVRGTEREPLYFLHLKISGSNDHV